MNKEAIIVDGKIGVQFNTNVASGVLLVNPSETREYKVWARIKDRCYNPNRHNYNNYGGRGITVCDAWKDNFIQFYKDMGPRPSSKHSIDRIDNNLGYSPGNCRWATTSEQNRNKRNSKFITYNNKQIPLAEFAEHTYINPHTLYYRLKKGWSEADVVKTVRKYTKTNKEA